MNLTRGAQLGLLLLVALVLGAVFLVVSPSSEPPPGDSSAGSPLVPSGANTTPEPNLQAPRGADPSREGVEATRASSPGGPLSVRLLWQDRSPIVAATLLFIAKDKLIAVEETDAAGRFASADPLAEASEVLALLGPLMLGRAPLERTGEEVMSIALGAPLEGLVTVNGTVPWAPLKLELTAAASMWGALPEAIAAQLPGLGLPRSLPITPDALGRFHVNGLASDWSGSLRVPDRFELAGGGASLALAAPRTGLLIELVTRPLLTGLVVSQNGTPLQSAAVESTLHSGPKSPGGPSSSSTGSVFTDARGRFEIALGPAPPERAELSITAAGFGNLITETKLEGLVDHDLGTLRLSPSRSLEIRTVTPSGAPIAGAIISHAFGQSAPTDAEGRTTVSDLPPIDIELLADAFNHRRGRRIAPTNAVEPFELVLEPMAAIDVTLTTPDQSPGRGLTLVLEGGGFKTALTFGESLAQNGFGVRDTGPTSTKTFGDGRIETRAEYVADQEGHALAANLESGVPIELSLRDASGATLGWATTITLAAGETRVIEVPLARPLGWLRGTVRTPSGAPIELASIRALGSEASKGLQSRSDRDGRFELGPLLAPSIDLWVEANGSAPVAVLAHPTAAPLKVTLNQGFDLVLVAKDASGQSWPITNAVARWRGQVCAFSSDAKEQAAPSSARLEQLPNLPMEIRAQVLGCWIQQAYAGNGGTLQLAVPTPGTARLSWTQSAFAPDSDPRIEFQATGSFKGLGSRALTAAELQAATADLGPLPAGAFRFRLLWKDAAGELQQLASKGTIESASTAEVALR